MTAVSQVSNKPLTYQVHLTYMPTPERTVDYTALGHTHSTHKHSHGAKAQVAGDTFNSTTHLTKAQEEKAMSIIQEMGQVLGMVPSTVIKALSGHAYGPKLTEK
ncbi:MAG: hypothetical protein KTR14_01380 [Vampirovibrio sp.]|nr:hypothetical protein [Vampirovibrio sp.]